MTGRMRSTGWPGAAGWLLALLTGCAADTVADGADIPPEGCREDSDCVAPLSCQFGVCAVEPGPELTVALAIAPPDFRPDLARQQIARVPVRLGASLPDLSLGRPVRVNGTVSFDADSAPAAADVRFESASTIPGFSVAAIASTDGESGAFTIDLPPGRYDVTILPATPTVPRRTLRDVAIDASGTNRCPESEGVFCQLLPLVLPSPERYVRLRGVLEGREPLITPISGARVFANAPLAGLESTVSVTDVDGSFTLFLPPEIAEYTFFVRPGEDPSTPSMTFEPFVLPDDEGEFDVSLVVPFPSGRGWLRGRVVAPEGGVPQDVAVITRAPLPETPPIEGALTPVAGSWEFRLGYDMLDANGEFAIEVPATTWSTFAVTTGGANGPSEIVDVSVVDQASLPAADEGSGTVEPFALELRPRHAASGRVVAPDGTSVAGAEVDLSPIAVAGIPVDALGVSSIVFSAATNSDAVGAFSLPLVDGRYEVTVIPPDGPGLARALFERVIADGSGIGDLVLPASGVVVGRVLDDAGQPLPGASVEAWLIGADGALRVGNTSTDAGGEYRLVLPAVAE